MCRCTFKIICEHVSFYLCLVNIKLCLYKGVHYKMFLYRCYCSYKSVLAHVWQCVCVRICSYLFFMCACIFLCYLCVSALGIYMYMYVCYVCYLCVYEGVTCACMCINFFSVCAYIYICSCLICICAFRYMYVCECLCRWARMFVHKRVCVGVFGMWKCNNEGTLGNNGEGS